MSLLYIENNQEYYYTSQLSGFKGIVNGKEVPSLIDTAHKNGGRVMLDPAIQTIEIWNVSKKKMNKLFDNLINEGYFLELKNE